SGTWSTGANWNGSAAPTVTGIANVRYVSGGNQTADVTADAMAWELNVSSASSPTMTVRIESGVRLSTFSGANVETGGAVDINNGVLDAQYVEVAGGMLRGSGTIVTGSGPIPGQVENRSGAVAPGLPVGALTIEGQFANDHLGTLAIDLGGT